MGRYFWTALRWLWGIMFVGNGVMLLLSLLGLAEDPFVQPTPEARAWYDGLFSAPFLTLLLGLAFLVGGLLMSLKRTAPLGLALVAGPVAVIVAYHFSMTGLVAWGLFTAVVQGLLMWRFRSAYEPLWSYKDRS